MATKNQDLEYNRKEYLENRCLYFLLSVEYPEIDSNRKSLLHISENELFLSVETLYRIQRKKYSDIINPDQTKLF